MSQPTGPLQAKNVPSGFDPATQTPPIEFGVWGDSAVGEGVVGTSSLAGGASTSGDGHGGAGVLGLNDSFEGVGVLGQADHATGAGIEGISEHGTGVVAKGGTRGILASGSAVAGEFHGSVGIGTTSPSAALEIDRGAANDLSLRLVSSGAGWGSGLQLANTATGARTYGTYSGSDGSWHFTDQTAVQDRLVVDQAGNIGIGIGTSAAQRILHVEGSEVHSGGAGGGFSFANREATGFTEHPGAGERWVWYASGGQARLWSGEDMLTASPTSAQGYALDVPRRMRVCQGNDDSAGIWFAQGAMSAANLRAFVGMADDNEVGFFGENSGWGLTMNVTNNNLTFHGDFGRPDGASTMSLWGSQVGDIGNGILFLRSGGSVVAFDGDDSVGIGTAAPQHRLHVEGDSYLNGDMFFNGRVFVSGTLTVDGLSVTGGLFKGGGGFKIDHPLDPAGKYLSHSFVESPHMVNLYNGTVVTDAVGEATVVLPDFFAALNRDYHYQLTPVGELARAAVIREIHDNSFTIRTDRPGVRVSWQVTGVRQDAWAKAHPIVVEEDKADGDRDLYLHPDVHGQPASKAVRKSP